MTDQWTEAEKDAYFAPGMDDSSESQPNPPIDDDTQSEYTALFDAPDYALFIKHEQTPRGKEYEQKVASLLKAAALGGFKTGNVADACTILHYGPAFAKRCGDLTDISNGAAKAIDIITAPDNPWALFAITAIPFALQFFRNHEAEARIVKKTWREARAERKRAKAAGETPPKREGRPVTIRLPFGRKLTVRVKLPTPAVFIKVFQAQTHEPRDLTNHVLSDPKLQKALAKQGIVFVMKRNPNSSSDA